MTLTFEGFRDLIQGQVNLLLGYQHLFMTDIDKDAIYALYLSSFPKGTDPIVKTRTSHDCSSCRQFIKQFGGVVAIQDNELVTVWDIETEDPTYGTVLKALANYVRSKKVLNQFKHPERRISTPFNYAEGAPVVIWHHLYVELSDRFYVNKAISSVGAAIGETRDRHDVFMRACKELTLEAINIVLDLISQGSLYRGIEFEHVVKQFQTAFNTFHGLPVEQQDNYCWEAVVSLLPSITKIRNSAIGTLLINISEGMDIDVAVGKYEAVVAPANYKRPKPIFSQSMLKAAERTVTELGLLDSLGRRFATIEDVNISHVLWSNTDIMRQRTGLTSVFDEMRVATPINPKSFSKVEEISIDTFINNVLPRLSSVEVLLEGRHENNLFSLIAPSVKDAPPLFKWGNNYCWAYKGNITDSMKDRVKAAGGNTNGVLRFSIQWNESGENQNDFDAHCQEPKSNHIYFSNKGYKHPSSGMLDVDIINPGNNIAVENIIWTDISRMPEGKYELYVKTFSDCGGLDGFRAEVEFDGEIHTFDHPHPTRSKVDTPVANITYSKTKGFSIERLLGEGSILSRSMWGKETNQFHPVSLVTLSPNYWGNEKGVGNLHYMFMLDGCVNPDKPNGFFNEFLRQDLNTHRKVFEALGSRMQVSSEDPKQLSGMGFSSTQRNSVVCRIKGATERMVRIVI